MRKSLSHVLLAFGVTGVAVLGVSGTAHASTGGCRYDYANVGLGYGLKPCVEYSGSLGYISGSIEVRELAHSTDVDVCGRLIPASGSGPKGPTHPCWLSPRDENVTTYWTVDQINDQCPTSGDYVYDTWIMDDGQRIGDVQSPRITC